MRKTRKSDLNTEEFRVYGPPGTGKTTWIIDAAGRAIDKYGEDQVSICSLTNSAIREVAGRELNIDPENVTTLHARCKRALSAPPPAETKIKEFAKEFPNYAGEGCIPINLLRPSRSLEDSDNSLAETILSGSREPTLYERAQILRQQMVDKRVWPRDVLNWFQMWDTWCKGNNIMDFTGWLETAMEVRALPAQQVVFVDEAQDHTPLQLAVIRNWNAKYRFLVGDDDQNLYEWSGAIPKAFFTPQLPEGNEIVLSQSHRVPKMVHREAMKWAKGISLRKPKDYLPTALDGKVRRSWYTLHDAEEGTLPDGLLRDSDKTYMFLASCSYMLNGLITSLKQEGIPFHNPYRRSNAKWNPMGTVKVRLDNFLVKDRLWSGSEARSFLEVLKAKEIFISGSSEGFFGECDAMEDQLLTLDMLEKYIIPNQLTRMLHHDLTLFSEHRKKGIAGSWDYVLKIYKNPESQRTPRVIVGTIHSVKGGEADCVYLAPDLSPSGFSNYLGINSCTEAISGREMRDRVMRLMYVGITRSKNELVLCEASRRQAVNW